jgi:mRNA interferase MazF
MIMERGEVWWALLDERCPVVVLSAEDPSEIRAIRIVDRATALQQRGFRLLSAAETSARRAARSPGPRDPDVRAVGVELELGAEEGLRSPGAVRIAFPHHGFIPCTWLVTLSRDGLVERVGTLSAEKLRHLDDALVLGGLEPSVTQPA